MVQVKLIIAITVACFSGSTWSLKNSSRVSRKPALEILVEADAQVPKHREKRNVHPRRHRGQKLEGYIEVSQPFVQAEGCPARIFSIASDGYEFSFSSCFNSELNT